MGVCYEFCEQRWIDFLRNPYNLPLDPSTRFVALKDDERSLSRKRIVNSMFYSRLL